MLKRFLVIPLALVAVFALSARGVEASAVDVDALVNDLANPVDLFLLPGDYVVTPVAGLFDAWSRHDQSWCDDYAVCSQGFENSYSFWAADIPFTTVGDGNLYQYGGQALANAWGSSFTVLSAEFVHFAINDVPLWDNRGGMSLDVAAVPEPATLMLLATGLVAAGRRRFRQGLQR